MIVYLIEVRHAKELPPRWIAKELYVDQQAATERARDLLLSPERIEHDHLYRIRPMHLKQGKSKGEE